MDTLRVQAALLRTNLPELVLRPGLMLPGRVLERAGSHGILLLAGTPLSAELPDELQPGARLRLRARGRHGSLRPAGPPAGAERPDGPPPGARLRLRVEEVSADRVVLRAVEQAAPAQGPPPAPPPDVTLPLPGGREAEVRVTE